MIEEELVAISKNEEGRLTADFSVEGGGYSD
jgi:hypothetical protein